MPGKITTPDEALNTVQRNPRALIRLPEVLKTPEVCLAAVQDIGIFWYNTRTKQLFGVQKIIASSQPFVNNERLHKSYWTER